MCKLATLTVSLFSFIVSPGVILAVEPLTIVFAHGPLEISGVAVLPNGTGYAVVGDGTDSYGRTWPDGGAFKIKPKIKDPESIDVAQDERGETLWLILGEKEKILGEPNDKLARLELEDSFREVCGRGVEGLSLHHNGTDWEAVVIWEGGYYSPKKCDGAADQDIQHGNPYASPRFAIVRWRKGEGAIDVSPPIILNVPIPESGRFRAPDIAWYGKHMVVLLASSGEDGGPPYAHTWLQRFDMAGDQVGKPIKLEQEWGNFWDGRNWEALDIEAESDRFVMAYDGKNGSTAIVSFQGSFE